MSLPAFVFIRSLGKWLLSLTLEPYLLLASPEITLYDRFKKVPRHWEHVMLNVLQGAQAFCA